MHTFKTSQYFSNSKVDFEFCFSALKHTLSTLYGFDWKPDTLMADAAGAITNGFMAAFAYLVILNLWNNKYSKAKSLNFEGIVSSLQKVKLGADTINRIFMPRS